MPRIRLKRVYETAAKSDGKRILVDRLWPRGLSKTKARIDFRAKTVAPSKTLRNWFRHDPEKWSEFKRRYLTELKRNAKAMEELVAHIGKGKTNCSSVRKKRVITTPWR